jgi:hypothetical protein
LSACDLFFKGWLDEQFNWNCATNAASGVVGHYTQMVWSSTQEVGCAAVVCNSNSPFGGRFGQRWTNVVCNYSPAGNFNGRNAITGQQPIGKCGNCARSARTADTTWGVADEDDVLEVCVPKDAATTEGAEAASACVCPSDPAVETPCAPPAEAACTNQPITCKNGVTLYPRQPDCTVTCDSTTDAASATLATAGALAAGAVLVL